MVSPARIELTASGLGNLRSIRLSYGDDPNTCLPFFAVKGNKKMRPENARAVPWRLPER